VAAESMSDTPCVRRAANFFFFARVSARAAHFFYFRPQPEGAENGSKDMRGECRVKP